MKVTLISLYADIQSVGVRVLSACLKKAGHQTQLIFLWCPTNFGEGTFDFLDAAYRDRMIREVAQLAGDSGLIGISLMTEQVFRARYLTLELRKHLSIPILWGGVHPTIRPEECLAYADMVCVGEGEYSLIELVDKMERGESFPEVAGIWFKRDGRLVATAPRNLTKDLDSLPSPDYACENTHILDQGDLKPLTRELVRKYMERELYDLPGHATYGIVSSRGCPYNCAFCSTSYFRAIYRGQYKVRLRSIDRVIEELEWAKKEFPFITGIRFHDDTFVGRPREELEQFRDLYSKRVALPFACYAHPSDVTEEKVRLLCDAGLGKIGMGIQTGSRRLQQLYRRTISDDKILEAAAILNRLGSQLMPPWYDMIVDYFNESEEDAIDSFRLLERLPEPYTLHVFAMVLWPGTELYEREKAKGGITNDEEQVYRASYNVHSPNYLTLVYYCYKHRRSVPAPVRRFLASPRVVHVLNHRRLKRIYPALIGLARRARHGFLPPPSFPVNT
ncbi:MAG: B12-binding domain-containing radical SAM protein [Lentisphaerae bacterium]|nr:B12-binding domain-containing radical SAM protein [Lentisphaerota bacterium]